MSEPGWTAVSAYLAAHGMIWTPEPPPRRFAGGLANINTLVHEVWAGRVF
jgi:hypothetical protein